MACGTPVIGAEVGGIKFSVANGKTGLLVPPKDPEALAESLLTLLSNESLSGQFKSNAIERVKSKFTWEIIARQMARLYDQMNSVVLVGPNNEEDLKLVEKNFNDLIQVARRTEKIIGIEVLEASKVIGRCLLRGGKIIACGNGGSAADAQHFVGELIGHFILDDRPGLPATSLTADTSVITAIANDYGYDQVFARQVEALGKPGDVLMGISTSGNSPNVIEAFKKARTKEITCIAILGKDGGELKRYSDISLIVPSSSTKTIQEIHIHLIHTICQLVEQQLFMKEKVIAAG
jgi:phosphoheptose isomerase